MNNIISLKNVSFSYGKRNSIYSNFDLDIKRNSITFIMGKNGCGKTTLLKLIASFLKPDTGSILVDGASISRMSTRELAKRIAYVPQNIYGDADFAVLDYLVLGRSPYKRFYEEYSDDDYAIVEKVAERAQITELLYKTLSELSGGQKQIVSVCRSLIQETPIIIMDEPMSALDIGKQAELLKIIDDLRAEGKTVVLTSHNPNHALQYECDVCLIDSGNIVGFGKNCDVLTDRVIKSVYGDMIALKDNSVSFDVRVKELPGR